MRGDLRQRRLEEITLGEIGPAEAFALVRELLAEDAPKFAKGVYLALQEVVWRLVSDRAPGSETSQWLDVCGRASVLLRRGGAEAVAHQVTALGDLVGRTARFFEAQPIDEVLGRRHVPEVLRLLVRNLGPTNRTAVLEATGLGQSNLSRILAMLEGHGLVRRDKSGREAELHLTEAGKAAAAKLAGQDCDVRFEAVWQARGVGICVLSGDGALAAANPGFEDAVGTPAELAAASVSRGSGSGDVRTAERRWARRVEVGAVEGGTAFIWVDVSDLHAALAEAEMRISAVEAKVAGLKEALAKAEAAAAAAEKRLRRQQLSVEVVRERAVGRLGSMARLVHAGTSGKTRVPQRSEEGPYRQIVAIKEALDNLLDVRMHSPRYHVHGRLNGRTIFEDVVKSTYALTNAKVAVEYPDWLRTEKADYVALVEPLSHFLLTTCGAVELSIDRDERNVVVHGVGHPSLEHPGAGKGLFATIDAAAMDAFVETWAQPGIEVRFTGIQSHDRGVEFRMCVPRGVEHVREALD